MRAIIVGMGVQGKKRKKYLGKDLIYTVDKFKRADFRFIKEVPLDEFDTVFACVPDQEKVKIVSYCIKNKKNVLVEKPFIVKDNKILLNLEKLARKKKVVCYTAYNHRFEPIIIKMKNLIKSKKIGTIYKCRMFYGNGTSLLVKKSKWRDKGMGVITDIGSHLIDICIYLFGTKIKLLKITEINKFENKAPDHAVIKLEINKIKIELEMTLCMWKNSFTCDVIASKGSAHLNSLCKWGKNTFSVRKRKFPSGKPREQIFSLKRSDPTWRSEYMFFKNLIKNKIYTNLKKDLILNKIFLNPKIIR